MPANRSRTERWRDCLHQIYERHGGLEITVAPSGPSSPGNDVEPTPEANLIWRVRILRLTDDDITVEHPAAVGHTFAIPVGTPLIAAMSVGQNRWMFRTTIIGESPRSPTSHGGVVLAMPENVQRCSRRDAFRVSTAELHLPRVVCFPLLDPSSVVAAEVANRAAIMDADRIGAPALSLADGSAIVLPEVGPSFPAKLMNVGGGGVGLLVERQDQSAADRSRLLWLRVDLRPRISVPLALTARVVHTHLTSEQQLYLGAAFEFAFHASHRDFVIQQMTRYIGGLAQRKAA